MLRLYIWIVIVLVLIYYLLAVIEIISNLNFNKNVKVDTMLIFGIYFNFLLLVVIIRNQWMKSLVLF